MKLEVIVGYKKQDIVKEISSLLIHLRSQGKDSEISDAWDDLIFISDILAKYINVKEDPLNEKDIK